MKEKMFDYPLGYIKNIFLEKYNERKFAYYGKEKRNKNINKNSVFTCK